MLPKVQLSSFDANRYHVGPAVPVGLKENSVLQNCTDLRSRRARAAEGDATGAQGFLDDVLWLIERARASRNNNRWVILRGADCFAFIRPGDILRPRQFLTNMAGAPPIQYGTSGFRSSIVDDQNPARHYMAFVLMGYLVPRFLAHLILWAWEILGFIRYGGTWSWPDIRSGQLGIWHGSLMRRFSVVIWPSLMARDLVEPESLLGMPTIGRDLHSS